MTGAARTLPDARTSCPPATAATSFEEHAEWARGIALSVYKRIWRSGIDRGDCIQTAMVGLLEALDRFDPERGIPFRAYAVVRVRGAVFNALRLYQDRLPTQQRNSMGDRAGLLADDAEQDPLEAFSRLVGGLGVGFLLEDMWTGEEGHDPVSVAEQHEMTARLSAALARLPERQRALVRHHYFLHRPFSDLVDEWGITKGRVSQLHREALNRLKTDLC